MTKTLILTEKEGWHFQELKKSLNNHNRSVESACLSDIRLSLNNTKITIHNNNVLLTDIDTVIVRFVPGGSLEEITFYLNILKIFEEMGIRVINKALQIESTVDKLYTSYLMSKNNINTPLTHVIRGYDKAKEFLGNNIPTDGLIYKPLFGSQGDNIILIHEPEDIEQISNTSNIYYFQEYLYNSINYDYRVLLIKDNNSYKYFYMTRYGDSFLNNYSKGGACIKEDIDPEIINLAIKSSTLLDMDFCGVDIMRFKNQYFIIEVNSIPAWKGLQDVEQENISEYFVNLLLT